MFQTHRNKMEGRPRLKQHDNVQKQISACEKLLQHAISKFSKDKLHQMLRLVSRGVTATPRGLNPYNPTEGDPPPLRSLNQLRDLVKDIAQESEKRGIQKGEEAYLLKYFETFFNDVEYLKELKQYFDERIYTCLYEYFYDPEDDEAYAAPTLKRFKENNPPDGVVSQRDYKNNNNNNHYKQPDLRRTADEIENTRADDVLDLNAMSEKDKLSFAVREMYRLNQLWDMLFTEEELDLNCYDPDSYHEVVNYQDFEEIEPVLRLVPDLFVKGYKSVELAKLWWTQATKVYKDLSGKRNSNEGFRKRISALESKIESLATDIAREEELINVHKVEVRSLEERENRYTILGEKCERVEMRKNELGKKYNEYLRQHENITEELGSSTMGISRQKRLEKSLKHINTKLVETYNELKLLTYHLEILQEDFQLELELRPSIIRYVDTMKEKLQNLEESVSDKVQDKRKAEKRLALMKTNTDRMKNVMRRYLPSRETSEIEEESPSVEYADDITWRFDEDDVGVDPVYEEDERSPKTNSNNKQVRYHEFDEVHTYSADDESDVNKKPTTTDEAAPPRREPRTVGVKGPKTRIPKPDRSTDSGLGSDKSSPLKTQSRIPAEKRAARRPSKLPKPTTVKAIVPIKT